MSALVATLLQSRGLNVTTVPEQATPCKTESEQLEFATSLRLLFARNSYGLWLGLATFKIVILVGTISTFPPTESPL